MPTEGTENDEQRVVVNRCFGGFGISKAAVLWIRKNQPCEHTETLPGEMYDDGSGPAGDYGSFRGHEDYRDCPSLVAAVDALARRSWGQLAELEVVSVPAGVEWRVEEYDGSEHISEAHRTW